MVSLFLIELLKYRWPGKGYFPTVLARTICFWAILLLCCPSIQAGYTDKVTLAQLKYQGGNWNPRNNALKRLAWEMVKRTSMDMELEPKILSLDDPELAYYPFLYMVGEEDFEDFSDLQIKILRNYLIRGGMLLVDSVADSPRFDARLRKMLALVLPGAKIGPVSSDHVLYQSFYMVNYPAGRILNKSYMEAMEYDGRLVVLYSHNDMAGAWERDSFGGYLFDVVPGGAGQREMVFRLGANILMYALCQDYKKDQVHIPFILKRRR